MDWGSIFETFIATTVSLLVAGIPALIWFGKRLVNSLFEKRLEVLKSQLEKKVYISKIKFDLEIEVYRLLSEKTQRMVFDNNNIFSDYDITLDANLRNKRKAEFFQKAQDSYNDAQSAIYQNAAFIPKELFELFLEISTLCRFQLGHFIGVDPNNAAKIWQECKTRSEDINAKLESLIERLRVHIDSLDVLDK